METRDGYDEVAEESAGRFMTELEGRPLDRALRTHLIERVGGLGPIADLGCGPGHVARFLGDHGAAPLGLDLSPRMVEIAAAAHPGRLHRTRSLRLRGGDDASDHLRDADVG